MELPIRQIWLSKEVSEKNKSKILNLIVKYVSIGLLFVSLWACKKEKDTTPAPTPPPTFKEIIGGEWTAQGIEVNGFVRGAEQIELLGDGKNLNGKVNFLANDSVIQSNLSFEVSFYQLDSEGNRTDLGDIPYLDFLDGGAFSNLTDESFTLESFGFIQTVEVLRFTANEIEIKLTDSQEADDFQISYTFTFKK